MFVSVRDQGRRRRSQTYGVSKAARSSKLSLLSAITTGSRGSNDSASTITQESYGRSSSSSGKRRKASKQRRPRESRGGRAPSTTKTSVEGAQKEKSSSKESLDVFAFLVPDEGQDPTPQHSREAVHLVQGSPSADEESDTESGVKSMHSDSGISMGDNSVYHHSPEPHPEPHLPPLPEETRGIEDTQPQMKGGHAHSRPPRWKWPDIPPATYEPQIRDTDIRYPSPEQRHIRFVCPPNESHTKSPIPKKRKLLSGYDLVADQLSRGDVPPVFRRFGKIHFRVLLQIQDEIVEMEEELAALDLADTECRLNSNGSTSPASRRINWQWNQSDLHARRLQVLGRLYIKLEQYYQALLSGQKVQRLTSQAVPADIERFRAWLQERNPLSVAESKFLDDADDVISLNETSTRPQGTAVAPGVIPLCIVTTALFPLLCFKFLTGILNRLILLTALLAAALGGLEKLDRAKMEQHQQWLLTCFGVSLVAALFF